jgi:hypothetical protein
MRVFRASLSLLAVVAGVCYVYGMWGRLVVYVDV